MLKKKNLYWQLFIYPVLYFPYGILNRNVIVKWLGCGCPVIDENGNMIIRAFNANDFTSYVALLIGLMTVIITILNVKHINKTKNKILYLIIMLSATLYMGFTFVRSQMWN
jgi:hypothetical protein